MFWIIHHNDAANGNWLMRKFWLRHQQALADDSLFGSGFDGVADTDASKRESSLKLVIGNWLLVIGDCPTSTLQLATQSIC